MLAGRLLVGMLVGKWQRLDSTHIYGLKHFISQTGCAVEVLQLTKDSDASSHGGKVQFVQVCMLTVASDHRCLHGRGSLIYIRVTCRLVLSLSAQSP